MQQVKKQEMQADSQSAYTIKQAEKKDVTSSEKDNNVSVESNTEGKVEVPCYSMPARA